MSRSRTRSLIMAVHLRSSYFGPRIRSMDGAWGAAAATGEGDSDRRIRACDARRLVSPGTRGPHYDLIVLLLFRLVLGDASPHAWRPSPALSLIHISEPTRLGMTSYAVFCLK